MRERQGTYRISVGRPEEKRPLLPRHRWNDNIKMHLQEKGWRRGSTDWTDLTQDRDRWQAHVNTVINLLVQ